ncbi:MAG: hypothetical protein U5R49_00580 [Deltaproteobacteria bacterium]|nr:hypothetical protein [Deltaproteobacteria bacterium]
MYNIWQSLKNKDFYILLIIISLIVGSFIYGWYFDNSKPIAGFGFFDQTYYYKVSNKLANNIPLSLNDFHFQMGYSILGAIVYKIFPDDPFMIISLTLLIGSVIFNYYGARYYFNYKFSVLFIMLLFFRYGPARCLYYAQDIFLIPWNNQIPFFCFSVFFWVFSKSPKSLSFGEAVFVSMVSGYTVTTRLESAVFVFPLWVLAIYKLSTTQKCFLFILFLAAASPHFVIQKIYMDTMFDNVRAADKGLNYLDKLSSYLSFEQFKNNIIDVIFNSSYRKFPNIDRLALLQAAPWLWLAPVGFLLFLLRLYRRSGHLILFFIISLWLFTFYLAGENMDIWNLKFHCLRYISPSYIALTFLSIYFIYSLYRIITWVFLLWGNRPIFEFQGRHFTDSRVRKVRETVDRHTKDYKTTIQKMDFQ